MHATILLSYIRPGHAKAALALLLALAAHLLVMASPQHLRVMSTVTGDEQVAEASDRALGHHDADAPHEAPHTPRWDACGFEAALSGIGAPHIPLADLADVPPRDTVSLAPVTCISAVNDPDPPPLAHRLALLRVLRL